jgi:hypothetical protein
MFSIRATCPIAPLDAVPLFRNVPYTRHFTTAVIPSSSKFSDTFKIIFHVKARYFDWKNNWNCI